MYQELIKILNKDFFIGDNFITNASNVASVIFEKVKDLNWVGFYILKGDKLELGPFQGKVACEMIPVGKGVCGTSAQEEKLIVVPDVHEFPGHIACDSASESEIVIPMIKNNTLFGVFDIDSPIKNRFGVAESEAFSSILTDLLNNSNMEAIKEYYENH